MTDPTPREGVVSAASDAEGIVIVRIFDAPREQVFKAWTEAERFATWFGEHGTSIPPDRVSMDARPGGAWSAVMLIGPEKTELPFSGHFREVVEPERVVLTLMGPDEDSSGNVEILTAVFKDLGDGTTEMTFTQRGGNLPAAEYARAMSGWLVFFDRITEHLKTRHDTES
jgi:uncharacterized protein YndB with AHSA1/START domain